jgi:hypothetical protein
MARRRNGLASSAGIALVFGAIMVGGALLWWGDALPSIGSSTAAVSGSVPGVTISGGTYCARQWRFLAALRKVVPASVPIIATSGLRTYEGQVSAMWNFWQKNGTEKFKALYPVAGAKLVNTPPSLWLATIVQLYADDILHADGHLTGGAIDIHLSSLSQAHQDAIKAGVRQLGATYIVEDPLLLHVKDIPA